MESVVLKGIRHGVKIVILPGQGFDEVFKEFTLKIEKSLDLLKVKSQPTIIIEAANLEYDQKVKIQQMLLDLLENKVLISFSEPSVKEVKSAPLYHTGTLRAGQNIFAEGHLIVLGDVNPGAEVTAVGNVVVLGILKGLVHAGATGNREATVVALGMRPTQIRIADIITRAPDGPQLSTNEAEIAYIKNDRIYIDAVIKNTKL